VVREVEKLAAQAGRGLPSTAMPHDDPRLALRQLAAELDDMLRTLAKARAARLRQLAVARSSRLAAEAHECHVPSRRSR
jgi:hypothetical protein